MGQQQQADIVFQKLITEARLNPKCPVSIPGRALPFLPLFGAEGLPIEVEASDIKGVVHCFKFMKRWRGQYPKPTIPESCWKTFAAIKGLIPGDVLTLYRILHEDTGNYWYHVRCERYGLKLFGAHLWVDVETIAN